MQNTRTLSTAVGLASTATLALLTLLIAGCETNSPSKTNAEAEESEKEQRTLAKSSAAADPAQSDPSPLCPDSETRAGCESDADCQLNGICDVASGTCACDAAWTGADCASLNLIPPAEIVPAYPPPSLLDTTASWGASVAKDDTGLYHMFVSEMTTPHLNQWLTASTIVHATSSTPEGPYERQDLVMPVFAHNPVVTRAVDQDRHYLIYHIGCGTGSGPGGDCAKYLDRPGIYKTTNILFSKSLWGPWGEKNPPLSPDDVPTFGVDNPAPYMEADGSVSMLGRYGYDSVRRIHADSWQSTYDLEAEIVAPWVVEDPFLYRDSRNHYHALFHRGTQGGDYQCVGGHAFSEDGEHWTFSKNPTYTTTIRTADGTETAHWRRERPHLIFDETTGEPTHLITGLWAQKNDDKTTTFIQRINTSDGQHYPPCRPACPPSGPVRAGRE